MTMMILVGMFSHFHVQWHLVMEGYFGRKKFADPFMVHCVLRLHSKPKFTIQMYVGSGVQCISQARGVW